MVLINTKDGATHRFDLALDGDYRLARRLVRRQDVTALSLLCAGVQQALTAPREFQDRAYYGLGRIERLGAVSGERIFVHVGCVRVSLTSSFKSKLIRCDLVRMGAISYNAR